MNEEPQLPVLPMELWTEIIIKEVYRQRIREHEILNSPLYDEFDLHFHKLGNLHSISAAVLTSSFTLTALKRTCKRFHEEILPYNSKTTYYKSFN